MAIFMGYIVTVIIVIGLLVSGISLNNSWNEEVDYYGGNKVKLLLYVLLAGVLWPIFIIGAFRKPS